MPPGKMWRWMKSGACGDRGRHNGRRRSVMTCSPALPTRRQAGRAALLEIGRPVAPRPPPRTSRSRRCGRTIRSRRGSPVKPDLDPVREARPRSMRASRDSRCCSCDRVRHSDMAAMVRAAANLGEAAPAATDLEHACMTGASDRGMAAMRCGTSRSCAASSSLCRGSANSAEE